MSNLVTSMTAVIGGKTYDLVPSPDRKECTGCAFARQCRKDAGSAPKYNVYYKPCTELDVVFKERKSK